ncbi:MAG: Crp/Fnr family transcriptional regulator, partial [Hyphomicrobiaceae bacterium]
ITGVVKVSKVLADGRQQIVGLLFPTESVGRAFSNCDSYFAEAATHVELCCFEKAGFERMLETCSGLSRRLLKQAQIELSTAHDWMVLLGRKTAEERVASLFLMLATRAQLPTPTRAGIGDDGDRHDESFDLYLKRSEIADFLGLTLETVSRQISALKRNGVISFSGTRRFSVPDMEALVAIAG